MGGEEGGLVSGVRVNAGTSSGRKRRLGKGEAYLYLGFYHSVEVCEESNRKEFFILGVLTG